MKKDFPKSLYPLHNGLAQQIGNICKQHQTLGSLPRTHFCCYWMIFETHNQFKDSFGTLFCYILYNFNLGRITIIEMNIDVLIHRLTIFDSFWSYPWRYVQQDPVPQARQHQVPQVFDA